ncbi:hypothetical protein [Blastococcus sp. KM273128]|nr:hypothetical protein [Blastococcus sp. KM273128]
MTKEEPMQRTTSAHPQVAAARKLLALGWWFVAAGAALALGLEVEDGVAL